MKRVISDRERNLSKQKENENIARKLEMDIVKLAKTIRIYDIYDSCFFFIVIPFVLVLSLAPFLFIGDTRIASMIAIFIGVPFSSLFFYLFDSTLNKKQRRWRHMLEERITEYDNFCTMNNINNNVQ
ncbi:hypothetical protein AKG60_09205 [Vibrio parahaemolyticus]|uniref:Uncharacterized protein n=1 Tax=Vibrio parahaemolyticus TaxID=670 RepID=A0AAX0MC52_VIBPH|nr:hypothetical protein [Vibrio vulnificus]EGQ8301825.1 hypothetical protein [Vibrio parahaemolyticus]MCS0331032.1 hypothetical protein [Vibrio diabolicus]ARN69126.1 hypothetical protein FORC36_4609 [Vibrio vulnificus]EGQ8892056.1 hypothetical protein [Vibrio parahaemolyticus]EGR3309508.1 hypothetical protein [Vibrio parahaemolyticus]